MTRNSKRPPTSSGSLCHTAEPPDDPPPTLRFAGSRDEPPSRQRHGHLPRVSTRTGWESPHRLQGPTSSPAGRTDRDARPLLRPGLSANGCSLGGLRRRDVGRHPSPVGRRHLLARGSEWQNRRVIRISVFYWSTTDGVDRSVAASVRVFEGLCADRSPVAGQSQTKCPGVSVCGGFELCATSSW